MGSLAEQLVNLGLASPEQRDKVKKEQKKGKKSKNQGGKQYHSNKIKKDAHASK